MYFYANPILIAAAVIPAVLLLSYVYKLDRLDREPKPLLWSLVFKGVLATFAAIVAEEIGTLLCGLLFAEGSVAYNLFMYFIVVACAEEGFKYLFLKRQTWSDPNFNCRFDGIVYAAFVALGFALIENVEYVFRFGMGAALVRAVTAVPGHASFGVFMGAFYGVARQSANRGDAAASKRLRRMAWLVPAVLHGLYDFSATLSGGWTFGFTVFVILLFIAASRIVKTHAAADTYI